MNDSETRPYPGGHCQRFYGVYSNRGRKVCADTQPDNPHPGASAPEARDSSEFSREPGAAGPG